MSDLTRFSACKLAKMIREKKCSAVEVAQAFLDRIEIVNPIVNAIHQVDAQRILAQAKAADKNHAAATLEKLHGVPISLKDAFQVKDFICCRGSYLFPAKPAIKNATVVQRLLNAGAIILGITNVPELLSAFETDNLIYGKTTNPYDSALTPGGSSGGEAALIAAGGSPLGLGTDAGGSIRVPAHYTGIAGLKPTKGLVPITGGGVYSDAMGLIGHLINFGPMARCVEDLILATEIIAGPDGRDPYTAPVKFQNPYEVNLKQLKVAFFTDNELVVPTTETIETVHSVINNLKDRVHSIAEVNVAMMQESYALLWDIYFGGGDEGEMLTQLLSTLLPEQISPLFQGYFKRVKLSKLTVAQLRYSMIALDAFRIRFLELMENYDIIICPVTASPALPHGETRRHRYDYTYAMLFNLLGWPVTVIRGGTSKQGLPIGVQIAAKPWCDHISLALAYGLQQNLGDFPEPKFGI